MCAKSIRAGRLFVFLRRNPSQGDTVVSMDSEDFSPQTQAQLAAQLRLLSNRVDELEHQLAQLRAAGPLPIAEPAAISVPPPPPPPRPETVQPVAPDAVAPIPPPPSLNTVSSAPQPSLESRLGAQIFNRIGIVALLFAATLGLKLAIDNQWIGPVGRILIGLIAGAGIVVWSERFRRKGFSAFSYSLKAVGSGVLYLALWAAFQLYHLLPPSAALFGMILVTAWNAYMAWAQDAELLAAYAVAGGFATPLLLSTGGNHEVFLFTYLLAIDVAIALLVRFKPWERLLLMAFPGTVLFFIGWYWSYYHEPAFAVTTLFIALFFLTFVSISIKAVTPDAPTQKQHRFGSHIRNILLPLGNAAFVSLALYSVMQDSDRHWFLPWLMLILAAAYLLITRLPQSAVAAALHLSLAVVFLTIAIPLKASGHWITVAWLVEGVALLWVATRLQSPAHASSGRVLQWLSAGSFVLGFGGLIASPYWFGGGASLSFFNHNLVTALIAVAAFVAVAWMSLRVSASSQDPFQTWQRFAFASYVAIGGIAILLSLREVVTHAAYVLLPAFANADFGMALLGIAILGALARASLRIARGNEASHFWSHLAAGSIIVINLVAVFTGVREISALWPSTAANPDLELQRALAVSAFLMIYGAALLAIGFWRRTAFIRWQALVLLVFTIGKTFLYDMRNLSQGYRFASFLALGVILMAISFAYQKDWLGLREPAKPAPDSEGGAR